MLFNSNEFFYVFLPLALAGFFLCARWSQRAGAAWLGCVSIAFYGYWEPRSVALLLASIAANFYLGVRLAHGTGDLSRRRWLTCGISLNLGVLGLFKYLDFFIYSLNASCHTALPYSGITLPLGISFFTFTQIAFLIDVRRGLVADYRASHYLLFVSFFPHLIAGPILHHRQMMPQFAAAATYRPRLGNCALGLVLFAAGLGKKVLLADTFAGYADPVFAGAASGAAIGWVAAWVGILAYTLQIYCDFAGYSDMAIGLSKLFNIDIPVNFNSPYRASSMIEFWRRWHMTLSAFLRDYLYFPLGGNRGGVQRRYVNLLLTMLLGGLWHGASWTLVVWGGLHGLFLIANHGWRHVTGSRGQAGGIAGWLGNALTLVCVIVAWVFFRADTFASAWVMLDAMFDRHAPAAVMAHGWPAFDQVFGALPLVPSDWSRVGGSLLAGWGLVLLAPNTQAVVARLPRTATASAVTAGAALFACCLLTAINAARGASTFIYFNF